MGFRFSDDPDDRLLRLKTSLPKYPLIIFAQLFPVYTMEPLTLPNWKKLCKNNERIFSTYSFIRYMLL